MCLAEQLIHTQKISLPLAVRVAIDAAADFATVKLEDGTDWGNYDPRELMKPSSRFHPRWTATHVTRVSEKVSSSGNDEPETASLNSEPAPPNDWPRASLDPRDTVAEQLVRKLRKRLS